MNLLYRRTSVASGLGLFRKVSLASIMLLSVAALSTTARAGDIESAKQALSKVKVDVDNNSWDSIEADIKSTEDFLDGVPDADRAPVQKELDELKTKAAAGLKEYKTKAVTETAKANLDRAASNVADRPQEAKELLDKVNTLLASDDAKKYVDADTLAKLQARANSLGDMATKKDNDTKIKFASDILKTYDEAMAANPFKDAKGENDMDHVVQDLNSYKSRINGALQGVPTTDPRVIAINDKLAAYDKTITAAAGAAGATSAAEGLAHQWQAQLEYFPGWDKETQSPTWEDYNKITSQEMSNLLMPKTVEVATRLPSWFAEDSVKTTAETYKDNASVKATMADAHKTYDTATAKLDAAFKKLLAGAQAAPAPTDSSIRSRIDALANVADMWLKGTTYHDADVAGFKAIATKWDAATTGAAAAKEAALAKLTADATNAWPAMASSIKADDGFTPDKLDQFKGKVIHLKGNNRMGWDYNPTNGYKFAKEINGMPVVGKFDANVAAAVTSAMSQTGQDLPDEGWDLYATVEGPGKVEKRVSSEGKVKIDGQDVGTVTAEHHESVDCAVVKIFALHAGPVAVSGTASSVTITPAAGGSPVLGAPIATTPSSFSFLAFLEHLVELGICVVAAGLVVMQTRPALASKYAGESTTALATGNNLDLAGLVVLALGVCWLLSKLIFGDLLPAGSLLLSGVLISSNWLQAKKLLPASIAAQLKPLALPVAGATVLFGLIHVVLWNWYLF